MMNQYLAVTLNNNLTNLNTYLATAKDAAEKLAMLFYPVHPTMDDDEEFNDHLNRIVNSYQSISFLVAVVNDALKGTDNLMSDLTEISAKEGDTNV